MHDLLILKQNLILNRKTSVGMPVWLGMRRSENGRTWVDRSAVNYLPPPWDYHSAKNQGIPQNQIMSPNETCLRKTLKYAISLYISICNLFILETCIYTSGDWYEGTCSNNLYFVCKRKGEDESGQARTIHDNMVPNQMQTHVTLTIVYAI